MVDTARAASSMWEFEDIMRQCVSRLFDWSENDAVVARRLVFREALLDIALGLSRQDASMIGDAGAAIHGEFLKMAPDDSEDDPS